MTYQPDPASRYPTYLDFFADSAMSRFRHRTRVGGRWPVRLLQITQPAHEDEDAATNDLVIGLIIGGSARARWSWGGRGRWNETPARRPGQIGVTPVRTSGLFEVDGPSTVMVISLPITGLRAAIGEDVFLDFGRLHDQYASMPAATRLCLNIWRAAGTPSPVSDDVIEAKAADLMDTLLAGRSDTMSVPGQCRLSGQEIALVDAMIADQGPVATTVQGLALALDMPVKAFRAAFRQAMNKRPHAYLIERRIELGCNWLAMPDRSIADIALDLGFANQAHFTMAFSRQIGIPPGQYRHLVRS